MLYEYAKLIKEYRERKFITQTELANLLGCKPITVCRWETGKFEPNMATKKKLISLFKEAGMKIDN